MDWSRIRGPPRAADCDCSGCSGSGRSPSRLSSLFASSISPGAWENQGGEECQGVGTMIAGMHRQSRASRPFPRRLLSPRAPVARCRPSVHVARFSSQRIGRRSRFLVVVNDGPRGRAEMTLRHGVPVSRTAWNYHLAAWEELQVRALRYEKIEGGFSRAHPSCVPDMGGRLLIERPGRSEPTTRGAILRVS